MSLVVVFLFVFMEREGVCTLFVCLFVFLPLLSALMSVMYV